MAPRASWSIGLVHDYLLVMRGAERTFATLSDLWPTAPIHTTVYSREGTGGRFDDRDVHQSWLGALPIGQNRFRFLLPFYPGAAESLPVSSYPLVLSSSSAFAHGVRPASHAKHVCYCHTPFRYAWHERERALEEAPLPLRPLLAATLSRIRRWDREASTRVTHYLANSELTRRRISAAYGRRARIVHPPVEVDRFRPGRAGDYFLVVTELVRHKRVELALRASRRAGVPIKVAGTGPDLQRLRGAFGSEPFLGRVSDRELADLYAGARALVVPNVEEFGIAAVEAQAAGRPVVAPGEGGARETVVDGVTGILVETATEEAFAAALGGSDFSRFSSDDARAQALRFAPDRFARRIHQEIERALATDRD